MVKKKAQKPQAQTRRRSNKKQQEGAILPFITGLSVGLFIAFVIYLKGFHHQSTPEYQPPAGEVIDPINTDPDTPSKPTFDFYTILPEREVKVPEWKPPEPVPGVAPSEVIADAYIFQVGSFKHYKDADRLKAKLAFLGMPAEIQKVVINGQETWFRVRVGPFKNTKKLDSVRDRLTNNNLDFILLRLKDQA